MAEADVQMGDDFLRGVWCGLSQEQKIIPARYFYDKRGSELFEEITRQPEYYLTRIETALLREHAAEIASFTGHGRPIVEFGAGAATKTPLLLRASHAPVYVPVDVSGAFLRAAIAELEPDIPGVEVIPVIGDFTGDMHLPDLQRPLTGFFPGSTIGNFNPHGAAELLRTFRARLGEGARLVIGMDGCRERSVLEAAYDDSRGVTAAFNRNLLARINRELAGTIALEAFAHRAVWNASAGRVEMHLKALEPTGFRVAERAFSMVPGETIHTENSYKYTPAEARILARASGWEPLACWSDGDGLFHVHVWEAVPDVMQP